MFGNFVFIIIAILIYSFHFPGEGPRHPWPFYPAGIVFFYSLFAWQTLRFFRKLHAELSGLEFLGAWNRGQYHLAMNRHTLLALLFYFLLLHLLELKTALAFLPSETLQGLAGLLPFFLFLILLWSIAWPVHQKLFSPSLSRSGYLTSQIRFHLPVVFPWLFATLCVDLAFFLPAKAREIFSVHEWTQLILYAIFFLFLGVFFPLFIKAVWGCRPITDPGLLDLLADLCRRTGVRVRQAALWPVMETQVITAGVMGVAGRFRFILLTPSLIRLLTREELESVLAHELGHTKKHHLLFYLFFFMGYAILSFLYPDAFFWFLYWSRAFEYFPDFFISGDKRLLGFLFFAPMLGLLFVYFRYLFGFFSRNFERQADLFSMELMGGARSLVSSLDKVALANGIDIHSHNWHHYGVKERMDFLRRCEERPEEAARHHRKVFYLKSLFIAGLLLSTFFLALSQQNPPQESVRLALIESALLKMAEKEGTNTELHLLLAGVRLEKKNEAGAIASYRRVLELQPENVTALNNLAWLLATAQDRSIRNYAEGLRLAEKAASLERRPYILDTLAECYFLNGEIEKAIRLEEEALQLETGDKSHYEKQLERFRRTKAAP